MATSSTGPISHSEPTTADSIDRPLSPEQVALLARAQLALASVRRAASLATFNGWTLAACAALCLPSFAFDPVLLPVGAGLATTAWAEFRGRRMLRALDARGPRWLAWNQLGVFSIVLVYCAWRLFSGLSGPSPLESPELAEWLDQGVDADVMAGVDQLYPIVLTFFYGAVLVTSALCQGACALYYLRRRRPLERHLTETPTWAREVLGALGSTP